MFKARRIGVIGHTGRGDYGHGIDVVWKEIPGCEIVAVADANPAGRDAAVKRLGSPKPFEDYREMLEQMKLDVVSICPRHLDQHRDMVVAAAERGIHMYMEKPLCRTLAEADEMIAACNKHDVKLALAHQTRYSPKLQVIRDMIDDGKLGRILELRGRGKEDRRGGGEDLWVLGSHIMNLMHHFSGEPNWCFATVQSNKHPLTLADVADGAEGIGKLGGDNVAAMYGMDDGVVAYFNSQRDAAEGGGSRFGLQIFGSKGIVEILTGYLPTVYYLPDPAWSPGRSNKTWVSVSSAGVGQPEPRSANGLHSGNIAACLDLLAAIDEDREPECSLLEGRTTIEMISAVFESHRAGGPVLMPLKSRESPLANWKSVSR